MSAVTTSAPTAGNALPVVHMDGSAADSITVDDAFFKTPIKRKLLAHAIQVYRANLRAGTASTKTRSDVSGGGKKPWKQKHTGRARAGTTRSPLWRSGGIIFGPHPRDFSQGLPRRVRQQAMRESLRVKARDGELTIVDGLTIERPSTKTFAKHALFSATAGRVLVVLMSLAGPVALSLRNLPHVVLRGAHHVTPFDVINANRLVVERASWSMLVDKGGPTRG